MEEGDDGNLFVESEGHLSKVSLVVVEVVVAVDIRDG